MNEMALFGDKRMTVKEVAEALGVAPVTVNQNVAKLFPGLAKNGLTTYLDEEQVTAIKSAIEHSGRNDLMNIHKVGEATTDLEMKRKTAEVMAWLLSENQRKDEKIASDAPKVESFEALQCSDGDMSITDAAKHFGLHPRSEVIAYLRERGYLTNDDLPTQVAIDADYLVLRQSRCRSGDYRPQAKVKACQLETWRTRVVPQIAAWKALI